MLVAEMVQSVRDDTQIGDEGLILNKLNSAISWTVNRILTVNADILKVTGEELTLEEDTRTYNLAGNVSTGILYQLKWLGVKFASDSIFHDVWFADSSDWQFIQRDQDTTNASAHPVWVAVENFNQVRFAPQLSAGTVLRVDYIYKPSRLAVSQLQTELAVPEAFHECVVTKATALAMRTIDDQISVEYSADALDRLYGALNVLARRQLQEQPRTRPSSGLAVRRRHGAA
jgi:hypothetical protein